MKIVFFGTSNVALPILEALSKHHEIVAVVTMPDSAVGRSQTLTESPVSVLANEMKLNVLKPEKIKNNEEFYKQMQNLVADLFVVVSYGKILPLEIINMPKLKTINVHFSLLPKYRGASPIQSAILNGETETGTSIFILDEKVDNGPVLFQEKMSIDSDDNAFTLGEKMAFKSAQIIIPVIDGLASGSIIPKIQDDSQATYTNHINKAHGKIDWTKTSQQIYNQFRAYYPWPGVWTKWNGKTLKITECSPCNYQDLPSSPGMILSDGILQCGHSTFLQIKTLQLESKNETKIFDFLNGYPEFVGSKLE